MEKNEKFKRITSLFSFFILLVLIAVQIYVLNSETALCRDDYSYSYTFAVKENKFRITNFREVIESQINHYKVMNGRAVTHTIAQTFLIFEKSVFNIFNTVLICKESDKQWAGISRGTTVAYFFIISNRSIYYFYN